MSSELSMIVSSDLMHSTRPRQNGINSTPANRVDHSTSDEINKSSTSDGNIMPEKVVGSNQDTHDIILTDKSALTDAVNDLAQFAQSVKRDLQFSIDEELNRTIITVYDSESEEVIRQIPSEEILELARSLRRDESALINVKA